MSPSNSAQNASSEFYSLAVHWYELAAATGDVSAISNLGSMFLAGQGTGPGSRPYRATRDMKRVQGAVQQLPPEEGQAVVLELDHMD